MAGNYDLSKVMSLADAQTMYKDIRDRMKEIEVPVEDVKVDGVSVVVDGIANIPAIPTVPVTDVQIDGTSILQNGVANIPKIKNGLPGGWGLVNIRQSGGYGLRIATDFTGLDQYALVISSADPAFILNGEHEYKPIVPKYQHTAVYYGLSKLAGVDLKNITATVGTYPDASKQAIQKLFGLDGILGDYESATASKAYAIGETFIYNGKRYRATVAIAQSDVIAPGTNCELEPLNLAYIPKNAIDEYSGLYVKSNGKIAILASDTNVIKAGANNSRPITAYTAKDAAFYGLAKAANDSTQASSSNPVGTYTTEAKAAILAMLGAVGTADIGNGLRILNGLLTTDEASATSLKNGTNVYAPLTSNRIHEAVYYGLAKAAGADMASVSGETVGVYPQAQKNAIQTMLGIEADIPLVETVTGATASITGMPNVRYICETAISELTITPPASGSIVVRFVAGSNCIVSLPQTVKLPEWFDISSLEAGTTYELIITDGVYGGVMSWAD